VGYNILKAELDNRLVTGGGDIELSSVAIGATDTVSTSSLTYTTSV